MRKTPPLELILWDDIVSHSNGWISPDEVKDMNVWPMFTVGFVVFEDEKQIKVMSTHSHPKCNEITYGHDTIIPAGAVKHRKVLRKRWWL